MSMKTLKMKLPLLSKRKVWIGSYGGHYECVIIFHTKPTKKKDGWNSLTQKNYSIVDLLDNKKNIAASMWKCDFDWIYPDSNIPPPKAIEVTTLYEREIEGFWDDDNRMIFAEFTADGW